MHVLDDLVLLCELVRDHPLLRLVGGAQDLLSDVNALLNRLGYTLPVRILSRVNDCCHDDELVVVRRLE